MLKARLVLWIAGSAAFLVVVVFAVHLTREIHRIRSSPPHPASLSAPRLDAVIKAVDNQSNLVLLSAGGDQKVEEGLEFVVHRGPERIGKVRVIRVYPDLAGAEVISTKDSFQIRAGDRASASWTSNAAEH